MKEEPAPHLKDFERPTEVKKAKDFEGFEMADTGTSLSTKGAILVEMSPEEYLKRCAAMFNDTEGKSSNLTMQVRQLSRKTIDELKEKMQSGTKMYTPWLDERGIHGQEGRHRAAAAYELGIEKIPVVYWERQKSDSRMDEEPASWITLENGEHVPLNEHGKAIGGAGGWAAGKDFSKARSEKTEKEVSAPGSIESGSFNVEKPESHMTAFKPAAEGIRFSYEDEYVKLDKLTRDEWFEVNRDRLVELYKEERKKAKEEGTTPPTPKDIMNREWYGGRTEDVTHDLHMVSKKEADETLYEAMGENVFHGWFRDANSDYKPRVIDAIISSADTRNAALSVMHENYEAVTGEKIDFEEFLRTPITMYRGGHGQKHTDNDVFSAYSFSRKVAEGFAGKDGTIYTAEIRPIDTWGSVSTNLESEIMVPSWIAPNKNTDSRYDEAEFSPNRFKNALSLYVLFEKINEKHYSKKLSVANKRRKGIIKTETRADADNRLAFGLCKEYGIELPEGAEPKDAWDALKGVTGKSPTWFYKHPGVKATRKKTEAAPKKTEEEPKKAGPYEPELLGREKGGDPIYSDETWKFLATGAVSFANVSFKQNMLEKHKTKHGPLPDGDGTYTAEEVENMNERARELLSQPVGGDIDGYVRNNGMIVRYSKSRNEYAAGLPGKKIHTIHKLNKEHERVIDGKVKALKGYEYFLQQKAEQEKKWKESSNAPAVGK